MKFCKPLCLIVLATGTMAADNGLNEQHSLCPGNDKVLFQTTSWVSPAKFSADRDTELSPINDSSGMPTSLQFYAPKGGRLSNHLQAPAGYAVKKILLCSNQNRPMAGVKLEMAKADQAVPVVALSFERMSSVAPGCAIYALTTGVDDWGLPGQTLDPAIYTRLDIVLSPSKMPGEIESVGVRLQAAKALGETNLVGALQAAAPHFAAEPQNQLIRLNLAVSHAVPATGGRGDDKRWGAENCLNNSPPGPYGEIADVFFTQDTLHSSHASGIGK